MGVKKGRQGLASEDFIAGNVHTQRHGRATMVYRRGHVARAAFQGMPSPEPGGK